MSRRTAVQSLVCFREVRQVLKAYTVANVGHFLCSGQYECVRGFQPAAYHPFLWGQVADFTEIPFECGKASSGVIGHFLQREVVGVVLFHEVHDIYLPRVGKVEKRGIQVLVGIQEYVQSFCHLQLQQFVRRLDAGIEIRGHGLEQAYDVGTVGRQSVKADFVPPCILRQASLVQAVVKNHAGICP